MDGNGTYGYLPLQSALGLICLIGLAWLVSENRAAVRWRIPVAGVGIQLVLALLLLKVPPMQQFFVALNHAVLALQQATETGSTFVFGYLAGGPLPFEERQPGASFILAFRALPLIIFVSALTALLTYWRILPWIVRGFAALLAKTLGIGGAIGLGTAANVFVGMVEAPLFIRPYLRNLTRSELFVLMSAGMATIAGTVLILYATILAHTIPDAVGQLLTASIISAPAAIMISLILVPETGTPTPGSLAVERGALSSMDAVAMGTQHGLQLFLNVIAMLLVLVALVSLANAILGLLPLWGGEPFSLQRLLGLAMAPLAWLLGIPWSEATAAGALLGIKTVLNELLAYTALAELPEDTLSARSRLIMTYALCGFANLGSLGIMIAGLTTMAPERRSEILELGMKSILAGTLATCCTGAVVGAIAW